MLRPVQRVQMPLSRDSPGLFCDKKENSMAIPRTNIIPRLKISARSRHGGLFGRLLRSRRGVTLIEFALVGPLFLLLAFAIVDNGLVLFMQTVLDNATREAAR